MQLCKKLYMTFQDIIQDYLFLLNNDMYRNICFVHTHNAQYSNPGVLLPPEGNNCARGSDTRQPVNHYNDALSDHGVTGMRTLNTPSYESLYPQVYKCIQ